MGHFIISNNQSIQNGIVENAAWMKVAQHEGQCELKVPSVEGGGLLSSTDASIREEATSSILCREQSVVVFEKERSSFKASISYIRASER